MDDFKRYVFQFNIDNAALNSAADKIETKLSEATRKGMSLGRSGKAEVKQSLSDIFGIAEEQAETLRKAMQGIVSMKPEGITNLKNQLKETLDFVSGIMTKMKGINDSTDWMKQGIGFVDSFKTLQTALENTQDTVSDLKASVGELKSSFQGFADAFKANNPSAYFQKFGDGVDSVVSKMEGRLKKAKKSIDSFIQSGDIAPGDFSDYSTKDLNEEYERIIQTLSDLDKQMSATKAGTKEYKSYLIEAADALADLQEINKLLPRNASQGMNTATADVVATIKQAGEDLKNTIKNLKIDDIKLTVTLPDANAAEFNAQIDNFVQQATQKFQGKPIEVSVDLISPFKDAKADTLPAEHEKKARALAEKFINAYNEAISQKDGSDKKAKEAIDISGQLSALYDPSVSSVLMKFWDSWNKIYDSVKAGQTTLLEATKNWKQKMAEELKLKFVWFNEDAAEGISDLFERINQMAEKNPIYLVPAQDYLVKEIEKVLSEHRFSLNVDLGDAQIPISFTGGSGGSGGSGAGGTPPVPSQTPPTSNSVPDTSRELAETVEEMQEFAYTAESINEVVERLSNNVNNISARITTLTNEINDLDLDKISDDKDVQNRKDDAKKKIADQNKVLDSLALQKKEQEVAYEAAKRAEEAARARLDTEKARRDQASQALREERDALRADNRTGQHTEKILALNEQIKALEVPFEDGISSLENAYNEANKKLLAIANKIRETGDSIARTNVIIEELKGTDRIANLKKELDEQRKGLTAEQSKQKSFQSILDKSGNPVSLITDRLTTFWESTDETIEKSRGKMQKLAPKLFSMENELKELQYELDNTDEEQDNDQRSALQERINALQTKIAEAEKAIDQKSIVKYRNAQKDMRNASTRQNWMRAFGLSDIRDLGADEALEVVTSVLQHYPALAASLSSASNGKVNLKGLNIVKQLIDFIPDVQSTLGVVATTNEGSNEELLLKETFVNLFRIADQLNALDGLVDKKTGEVTVEALSGFITAFEKMPQMATVVQKAKALQKSTDELSDVLGDNEQLKQAFDIGEAKKYLTESFYDLWKAMPETVRSKLSHKTLDLNKLNSVDKTDGFVKVVYDEFVRAFSAGNLDILKTDSPEWQSLISLLKQGAIYANHEKATKGLKDSVMGSDGVKRGLYELLHSADPIHVRVVGRDGMEHDYGVQDTKKAKMDVEHTYGQTPRSLRRAANKFGITDLLTEKLTIEKGIDTEISQVESELVALDERISKLDKEADKRQIERLSALRDTKQGKLNHLRELSKTDDGRRQYEKESARRLREIDEEIFGKVSLSTKKNAPKRKARREYEYGDSTVDKVKAEVDSLKDEKKRLEDEIAAIDKKEARTDKDELLRKNKAARLEEIESLLAVDNAQKMAIDSVRELDKDIETNTAKYQEAASNVNEYTRSLEALADAERKKNVLKDTKDNTFNTISRGLGSNNRTLSNLGVAKQYGTMDKQLVEDLEAKIAERAQLMDELDAIPMSRRYDSQGKPIGRAATLFEKIKELRIEIAQKYSEAEGSYLTNLLAEQLEQIDSNYDRQEADVRAQSKVKSSDYQTQADAVSEQHRKNVKKINETVDTQKAYYENLIGNAQRESDRITEEWQDKVRQLNENVDTRANKEVRAKDTELYGYYYTQIQEDERILALRKERETATPQRRQEISGEISKIELEYTTKYQEEIAEFKENLVRDFRKQMEEEARKVEEEGSRNAEQVLENARKEAVATYNNSKSRTGKKVRVYTSIERELEEQRKAAIKAEGEAYKTALAQITQVDPKQIEQETKAELARIKAEREAKKQEALDKFKASGAYKTDETLITEHITTSKEGAEKKAYALNQELEQRRKMRKTLMDEYHLSEEMVATQEKVTKADVKRVKVKAKSAQSSAAESNTPPSQEPSSPSGGGKSGGSGGSSYGGFINTNGLAQESTLRGIWELLNGGAPAGGWGDENDGKSGASSSVVDLNKFAAGISDTASIIKDLPHEAMGLLKSTGEIVELISGTKNGIADKDINTALARHVNETILMALHNHPQGDKALSEDDLRGILGKSVKTSGRANVRFGASLADGTITSLDALQIPEKLHNTLISNYHKALVEELNNNPDVLAMNTSNGTFDGDIGIRSDILDNPELKAKAEEAMTRALVNALNKTVHNANAFKQFDVSGIQGFVNQVVKPAQEQVAKNVTHAGAQAAVESAKQITAEDIKTQQEAFQSQFKTKELANGKKGFDINGANKINQALLNARDRLNKTPSELTDNDITKLTIAYDQLTNGLQEEIAKHLDTDTIAFLNNLKSQISSVLDANAPRLEEKSQAFDAIKEAKEYLSKLKTDDGKRVSGANRAKTGIDQVYSVLNNGKSELSHADLTSLGQGYYRLQETVNHAVFEKLDENTKKIINEAIAKAKEVLDKYGVTVSGNELVGTVLDDSNANLYTNANTKDKQKKAGRKISSVAEPQIAKDDKVISKASVYLDGTSTKQAMEKAEAEEQVVSAKKKQKELSEEIVNADVVATKQAEKKANVVKNTTPKPTPTTTPTYSAGVPQPTGDGTGGGIPALVRALVQLPGVVAKDTSVQEIIKALTNGIKTTGSGGKQSGEGENKSLNLSADEALERITAQINADYPGAIKTGSLRANANSYSVDFWRQSVQAQKEAEDIQEKIHQLEAEGKANTEDYNTLIQQRNSLLQKQEKITLKINKDTGKIESKVGIENYAVGANAAEKELQKFQGILAQLHDSNALQFNPDGQLTSQNQSINSWIQSMQALQVTRDKFASEGTLFDSKNQQVLSQMTAQTSQLTKEVLALLNAESKFGGNVVDTFANPQALAGTGELYNKLLGIATAAGKVDMATVKFNNETNTLTYTMQTGKNEVQEMTLHMNALNGAVSQNVVQTKHVDTAWEAFGKSLKGKWQEVARYLTTFGSIYRVWGMLKQGVQYVKEIDTALTELKKVTSETDKTYNKFLQDMAKTGSVVGATVQDLTKSAADWARLGYSLKEAGELAKNTAVLMNVSEFEDVNKATDTLISSLQAFKKAGQDVGTFSMEIIDKYNEVGK